MIEQEYSWNVSDLAHPGKRYQAQFIDGLISILLFIACIYITKTMNIEGVGANIFIVSIPLIYFVFSDAFPNGQSIGKKLLNISVVSKFTGKHCTIWQSFIRNAFTPLLGIIDAVLILGKRRQRLGDLMANTIVIKKS